jgi:hypothetical protein
MTEKSFLWNTGAAGDGSSTYTRAEWSVVGKIFAACNKFEGIAPNYLNELAASVTGANTVQIATGGALVDGKPYNSDGAVNVTIPSASGAGNTRIDRIVVRVDWTTQTGRITRIAGVDAASPTAPNITQTTGTTYDMMICRVTVNTSGTVTVVDERVMAQVATNGIANAAVTLAKMASNSVDASKIVDGSVGTAELADGGTTYAKLAPGAGKLTNRQGGSATNWSTAGTTNYVPTAVRNQCGVARVLVGTQGIAVTFPVAFSNVPIVVISEVENGNATTAFITVNNVTASGFTVYYHAAGTVPATFDATWLAIGPE